MTSLETFEDGDFILYGDRKQPLTVKDAREDRLLVEGPQGGEYVLFYADDGETLLEATPGKRQYASAVDAVREVGHWEEREEGHFVHSKTGDTIDVEQNETGFWTIETTLGDVDVPQYGYTERDKAIEKAKSLVTERTDPTDRS